MPGKLSTGLAGEVDEWMFRPQGATEKELLAWTQPRNEELNHNQLDTPDRLARHYDYRRKTWKGEWKPGWWKLYRPKDLALTLDHARVRIYNPDAFDLELVKEAANFILDGPKGTQADREIAQRLTAIK
jgi:hypothetical protein